jgi:CelD/BcsL family acetyltransferase involved in cellulose biosynthesis
MRFRVLDAETAAGHAAWLSLWEGMPGREIAAHPEYALLFRGPADRALALAGDGDGGAILFPLLARPLAAEPWARRDDPRWDAASPYGHGGPFAWGPGPRDERAFWVAHGEWCRAERVVSTFARLSLFPERLASLPGRVEARALNVVRTLGQDAGAIWRDYAHPARTNVRAAQRAGLVVEVDERAARLGDFVEVYGHTMSRRGASAWYRFPAPFFERLVERLSGHVVLFHARLGRRVVSSELVLCSDDHMHAFLGGTYADAYPLRPNDLLRHAAVEWGIAHGKKAYVLGGGHLPDDGIFRHKRNLAPRGTVPFRVATMVHDEHAYQELVRERAAFASAGAEPWTPRPGFFPQYRS